jgi:hypothetical protein
VVEFNDLAALDAALCQGDVACVLAEPVMTNIGMVLPDPGYWSRAQQIIRRHGALLVMDETHTISTGPGGYARAHGIEPTPWCWASPSEVVYRVRSMACRPSWQPWPFKPSGTHHPVTAASAPP